MVARNAAALASPGRTSCALPPAGDVLERHRRELTEHCYRMLGARFDAEDAVQDTLLRAWRSRESFDRRATLRSWLYRIATNVCLDQLKGRYRRPSPMDLHAVPAPTAANEGERTEPTPVPLAGAGHDPAEVAASRETVRHALAVALRRLPPRQRAVLILRDVLHWRASEAAELLDTSDAAVNSALQRARATLSTWAATSSDLPPSLGRRERELLARYVEALERADMDTLTTLIREDAMRRAPGTPLCDSVPPEVGARRATATCSRGDSRRRVRSR